MNKDYFAHKAGTYEQNKNRVDNVDNIAKSVLRAVTLDKHMHIMDFGSGTGLLLERIAPYVGKITAVDISPSMNAQLVAKRDDLGCELDITEIDLEKAAIDQCFDGIISSMTMHHVKDVPTMFKKFHTLLNDGGFIAIADLDREDGSFHAEDTGVYHTGFDRDDIAQAARNAGFHNVEVSLASVVHKDQGDYPVFLLTGVK